MKQREIIDAVRAGRAEFFWLELEPGLDVFADALKIDGVRVGVSARTAQAVADMLGASLTTPPVEDRIYQSARVRIPPFTFPKGPDGTWAQVLEHSRRIDEALRKARGEGTAGGIVATAGKSWCLVNELSKPDGSPRWIDGAAVACNYGWHSGGAPYQPATGTVRVWQPASFKHNVDHHDYSQTLRLCRASVPLPTADGKPLRVTRQPGLGSSATPPGAPPSSSGPAGSSGIGEALAAAAVLGLLATD